MDKEIENDDLDVEENEEETETTEEEEVETQEELSEEDDIDWEARAKKAEQAIEKAKRKKKNTPKVEAPEEPDLKADVANLKLSEKKRQFGYEHDLSPKEVDKVFKVNSNPDADTLKDPFVKAGLEAVKKADKVKRNTPSSSTKTSPYESKKFDEMKPEEKQAEHIKAMQGEGIL